MANEPNFKTEGGIGNVNPNPQGNPASPLFTLTPYQGMTAAKAAALVSKEVG